MRFHSWAGRPIDQPLVLLHRDQPAVNDADESGGLGPRHHDREDRQISAAACTEHPLADNRIDVVAGIQQIDQMAGVGHGQLSGLGQLAAFADPPCQRGDLP
jgi:hypothetical protein